MISECNRRTWRVLDDCCPSNMAHQKRHQVLFLTILVFNIHFINATFERFDSYSPESTDSSQNCIRRSYSYKVKQEDSRGRSCWDNVSVMTCWGRCDSNEIADWRFPFKRSHHPVCQHDEVQMRQVVLKNCDPDVEPGTESFLAIDAVTCRCQICRVDSTICEGLHLDRRLLPSRRSTQ